ncbi:hypothetical protein N752_00095 [Desulforamulus aquiferis]|nr:hypothetical protein [Desulforamulus aquiferis]RYD07014.1 hypothetical protein N752_00095 [Desulforamulus aquiferis]
MAARMLLIAFIFVVIIVEFLLHRQKIRFIKYITTIIYFISSVYLVNIVLRADTIDPFMAFLTLIMICSFFFSFMLKIAFWGQS